MFNWPTTADTPSQYTLPQRSHRFVRVPLLWVSWWDGGNAVARVGRGIRLKSGLSPGRRMTSLCRCDRRPRGGVIFASRRSLPLAPSQPQTHLIVSASIHSSLHFCSGQTGSSPVVTALWPLSINIEQEMRPREVECIFPVCESACGTCDIPYSRSLLRRE